MSNVGAVCAACGQRLPCANAWCACPGRPLGAVYAAGPYRGALARSVVAYKYGRDLRWARPFAGLLHGFLSRHATWFEEFDVLCPVPAFLGPGPRPAWDHVGHVCRQLAALTGPQWAVQRLVVKTGPTPPMAGRRRWERRAAVTRQLTGSYHVPRPELVEARRIILVDDVCASGSTLLAVAGVLRRAGAEEVIGLVVARALWRAAGGPARPRPVAAQTGT